MANCFCHVLLARDFNNEADEALSIKDPTFQPQCLSLWQENVSPPKADAAFAAAERQLAVLNTDARKAAWERDNLVLAKDIALVGQLFQQESKSQRAERTQRVVHVRAQNVIGASIVSNFMSNNVAFLCGKSHDLAGRVDKANIPK